MTQPQHMQIWQGRVDEEDAGAGLRIHQIVQAASEGDINNELPSMCLIGLASDLGVQHNQGRVGASEGPAALRKALANLAWHKNSSLFDAGDLSVATSGDDPLADAQSTYAKQLAKLLQRHHSVLGLGGGHEIGWASYLGYRQYLDQIGKAKTNIGIINFDAHFDLRKPPPDAPWAGSSGTPFYQVAQDCQQRALDFNYACLGICESSNTQALFHTADELDVSYLLDTECTLKHSKKLIKGFLKEVDYLYVTICLDALPAAIAPGVSAPAALGIDPNFIINTLRYLQKACDKHNVEWLLSDIAELNPKYDIDSRTANVAARLAYEIMRVK